MVGQRSEHRGKSTGPTLVTTRHGEKKKLQDQVLSQSRYLALQKIQIILQRIRKLGAHGIKRQDWQSRVSGSLRNTLSS